MIQLAHLIQTPFHAFSSPFSSTPQKIIGRQLC